jgi:hypothetical protein
MVPISLRRWRKTLKSDEDSKPLLIDASGSILVVCEGGADARFLKKMIERENLTGFRSIHFRDGYTAFGRIVEGLVGATEFEATKRVVIVGDNDTQPNARFKNAADALTRNGLVAPATPGIIEGGTPSTAIFLLPSAGQVGVLETLLVGALFEKHPHAQECVDALIECSDDCGTWDVGKLAKARFASGIAITCKKDPSVAAQWVWSDKGDPIDPASTVFDEVANFLRAVAVL